MVINKEINSYYNWNWTVELFFEIKSSFDGVGIRNMTICVKEIS